MIAGPRARVVGDDRRRPGHRDAPGRRVAHRRPGACDNARNLSDDQLRGVAATGGLIGIGFWPTAWGGEDAAAIARLDPLRDRRGRRRARRARLRLRRRGPVPFDATGMVRL